MIEKVGCPFCGKTDGLSVHKFYNAMNWYKVTCSICKASGGARLSEVQAIEAWNSRTPIAEQRLSDIKTSDEP